MLSRSRARFACFGACLALAMLCALRSARADGAFPDSLGILLPSDQPQLIIAATNFGLLRSDDAGASFYLVCEDVIGTLASLYQVGPAPDDRLFSVTVDGLAESSDAACSWNFAQGLPADVYDVFADPSNPSRVLAIGKADATDAGAPRQAVFESRDGGKNFDAEPRYLSPASAQLTGVEIAKRDPMTIYVALFAYAPPPLVAYLVRSRDGGANWEMIDLGPMIGTKLPRILGVDPDDANKVYLRLYDNGDEEQFGAYDAENDQLTIGLHVQGRMSAFLRRSDGALIVGAANGGAFISNDGGQTFGNLPGVPHLRALGERGGDLFAVADDKLDGYAVGVSHDQGASWQALVSFANVQGPLACGQIADRCAIPFQNLQTTLSMSPDTVTLPGDIDGGQLSKKPTKRPAASSGCSAARPESGSLGGQLVLVFALLALVLRRSRAPRVQQL